jgi:predicted RNase H-like nuclease (RuvC/YqgF family)
LIDSHKAELQRLEKQHNKQLKHHTKELEVARRKAKKYTTKNQKLIHIIEQYKTVVQASQNKAMEVCEDAFEELDAEKQKNESLAQHCQSIEELNVSLNESLQETLRLFDKSKQSLLHQTMTADKDRNRWNSVMDALVAGSTEELDGRLRFSSLRTRPVQ